MQTSKYQTIAPAPKSTRTVELIVNLIEAYSNNIDLIVTKDEWTGMPPRASAENLFHIPQLAQFPSFRRFLPATFEYTCRNEMLECRSYVASKRGTLLSLAYHSLRHSYEPCTWRVQPLFTCSHVFSRLFLVFHNVEVALPCIVSACSRRDNQIPAIWGLVPLGMIQFEYLTALQPQRFSPIRAR